ncbi:unnamed protein product [Ilex paraguariensis]|uniref:Uncharacterized protein n=1 Tax=Ilex paraguariensis TaxID=185542 RepID=A0ABC8RMN9_9AQUA
MPYMIQLIMDNQRLPCLYNLFAQDYGMSIRKGASWMISNLTLINADQVQLIMDNQRLPCLYNLFAQDYGMSIRKGASWMISNLTLINADQVQLNTHLAATRAVVGEWGISNELQAVIESNIISPLVFLLGHAESQIKEKVAWAISNVARWGYRGQIRYLVSKGCIKPLCDLIDCEDVILVIECMKGLECILRVGEAEKQLHGVKANNYARMIEQCGGLSKIMRLLVNDRTGNNLDGYGIEILQMADNIFESYFYDEEE